MHAAIIVTFNPDIEILSSQFDSLLNQIDYFIYVDNASREMSVIKQFLEGKKNKHIYVIFNSQNMGLGYAHNQGIQKAISLNVSDVLILDHDSILKPYFVDELILAKQKLKMKGENIGAVGPIYCNEKTGEVYPITKYWGPFIKRMQPTSDPVEASVLISSGTLISIDVLKDVGGMHEGLFVDYIDIEWSYRVRRGGYKLYAVPKAVMNHQIGDNRMSIFGRKISVHSPIRRYFLARNSIHMLRCPYISYGYKLRELIFNIFRILIYSFISKKRMKYLNYSFRGLIDGFKGIYGDCTLKQNSH